MKDKARELRETARYADMFGALGIESRLSIIRLLLKAHPQGMAFPPRPFPTISKN
jgi:hypothetical protein